MRISNTTLNRRARGSD